MRAVGKGIRWEWVPVLLSLLCAEARAALHTSFATSATYLVDCMLGSNIISVSGQFRVGATLTSGRFTGGETSIGFADGVDFTTGCFAMTDGPHVSCGGACNNELPGDPDLDSLAGYSTHDATRLQFTFVPNGSTVSVDFAYGGNEYHDCPWTTTPNVFAIFINGVNIAHVPGTSTLITESTVNASSYPMYYRDNACVGYPYGDTNLNGFTVTMTASVAVNPCVPNFSEVVIADHDSWSSDSVLFITTGGFRVMDGTLVVSQSAPSSVGVGSELTYEVSCFNAGDTTITGVTVWDTLPSGAVFVSASSGGTYNGTRISWALASVAPWDTASVSFTVYYTQAASGTVQSTVSALRPKPCPGYCDYVKSTAPTTILHGLPILHKSASPSGPVCTGQPITYTISWYNGGSGTTYGITITDTLPDGVSYTGGSLQYTAQGDWLGVPILSASAFAASTSGPWTGGEPPGGAASPLVLRWTIDRVAPGATGLIRYGVMVQPPLPANGVIGRRASATVSWDANLHWTEAPSNSTAADLSAQLRVLPTVWTTGQDFMVTLTVTNDGCASVSGLSIPPLVKSGTGAASMKSGPSPPVPGSLAGGASLTLTWTYTGVLPGSVWFSTTAQGTDDSTGLIVSSGSAGSNAVTLLRPASLAAGMTVVPTTPCIGMPYLLVLTLSNSGDAAANVTYVSPLSMCGAGTASVVSGSAPVVPFAVDGDSAVQVTWTATGLSVGSINCTVTASGVDAISGASLTSPVTEVSGIFDPGALEAGLTLPARASSGQWMNVYLTVTNTGGSSVSGVAAVQSASPGAMVVLESGPTPTGPLSLSGGASQSFTWTYSVSGTGLLSFSATVSGQVCGVSPVLAAADGATDVVMPASLRIAVSVSGTPITPGQWLTVVVTVTNTGGAAAALLDPFLRVSSGQLAMVGGPVPISASMLSEGATASFTWTWSVSGVAPVAFTASAAGFDINSGSVVAAGPVSSPALVVWSPARLEVVTLELGPSPVVPVGAPVTATLVVQNAGGVGARIEAVYPGAVSSQPGVVGPPGAVYPSLPVTLAGGASQVFTWTQTATGCGTVASTVTVSGTESGTGRALPGLMGTSRAIAVAGNPVSMRLWPAVQQAPAGTSVAVEAYLTDTCGIGVPGIVIVFSSSPGGEVSPGQDVTDAGGVAHTTLLLGVEPGLYQVRAQIPTAGLCAVIEVEATPGLLTLPEVGAALSANVISPRDGDTVTVRVHPIGNGPVSVRIYTSSGRLVADLHADQPLGMGQVSAVWDGRTSEGRPVERGVYLVQVTSARENYILKLVLR